MYHPAPSKPSGTGYFTLTHLENTLATDLSYSYEQSDDLDVWDPLVPAAEDITVTPIPGSVYQEVTIRVPATGSRQFLRIVVQQA